MARGKGTANLAASLEVLAGAPLDARDVCPTVADLYVASNWPYKYIGMKTTVVATGETYRLVNLDVTQTSSWVLEGSGSGGGHTIEDDGTELTQRDTLNFVGFDCEDDDTEEKTQVAAHELTAAEMAEIISPLPYMDFSNPSAEAFVFSTNERVIGQWIDGKPLYQKTITGTTPANDGEISTGITNGSNAVVVRGTFLNSAGYNANFAYADIGVDAKSDGSSIYFNYMNRTDFKNQPFTATIQYTKTTDTAVASGEKIVGQWIDGKPLFEKVYSVTSPSSSGNANIADMPANYDYATIANWDITLSDSVQGDFKNENNIQVWIRTNNQSGMNKIAMHLESDSDYYNKPVHVTLRYTKV